MKITFKAFMAEIVTEMKIGAPALPFLFEVCITFPYLCG